MKKLSEILTGPETWCQGAMQRGERLCLMGALSELILLDDWRPELAHLRRVIVEEFGALPPVSLDRASLDPVAIWNDAAVRTWDDIARVVDAYDRDRVLNP